MAFVQMSYFSTSIWRQTVFHVCLPNDVPPEMKMGNKNYDRPMKVIQEILSIGLWEVLSQIFHSDIISR